MYNFKFHFLVVPKPFIWFTDEILPKNTEKSIIICFEDLMDSVQVHHFMASATNLVSVYWVNLMIFPFFKTYRWAKSAVMDFPVLA